MSSKRSSIIVHKAVYQIAVATFLGSIFWTSYGVYNSMKKTENVEIDKEILEPLNPTIDMNTIEALFERRKVLEGVDLSTLAASPKEEEALIVQPETATESATVEATNSATVNEITTTPNLIPTTPEP